MFEVGRQYEIVTQDHEGQSYYSAKVLEFEFPMLKLERLGIHEIHNVTSPAFVRATPNDQEAKDAMEKFHQDFMETISLPSRSTT